MERKPSGNAHRRKILPPAKAKREVLAKRPSAEEGPGVVFPSDVLRLEVEEQSAAAKLPPGVAPDSLYPRIEALSVVDDESFRALGDLARAVKRTEGRLTDHYDASVKAADKAHKEALFARNTAITMLQLPEAEALAKQKLAEYMATHPEAPKLEGVFFPDEWTYEIVDASSIPGEYRKIDESKIRDAVKALKESTDIPGVRVFSQKKVTVHK